MNRYIITYLLFILSSTVAMGQLQTSLDGDGNISMNGIGGKTGGRGASRDSTKNKEIPQGITVWTVNAITGDRTPAEPDTASYLRMNYCLPTGIHGEYNTLGNNGSPRLNRIFIDRQDYDDFIFTNGYSQILVRPDQFHFTNTYSPITNLDFSECGDRVNGEDHLKALFAVNVDKKLGFGFKFDYLYARGYYANQQTAHFNYTMWGSYLGDRYQAHLLMSTNHQKQVENGGIANDEYIKHPESFSDSYSESEIPTVLSSDMNRNDNQHLFFTHRYSVGFSRRVPMTEQEIEAKKFAMKSAQEKAEREAREKAGEDGDDSDTKGKKPDAAPTGRPDNAKIVGDEPGKPAAVADTTRIALTTEQAKDSLLVDAEKKEENEFMKDEYVPVTSFFHTLNLDNYHRTYISEYSPTDYYLYDYYAGAEDLTSDFRDKIGHVHMRNTLGMSMLEGFNKWMKAGLKLYGAHELKQFSLPLVDNSFEKWTEHNIILGGEISKHEGKTLHFDATAEFCPVGVDAGQLSVDGNIDLNFPLLGDTVRLEANGFFHLFNPATFHTKYHSRHFDWDVSDDFGMTTHTHVEGNLSFSKIGTRLRVAVDNLTNYTYLSTTYNIDSDYNYTGLDITPRQASSVQILTAQLYQNFKLGILHWDNILTYQKSTDNTVLPLPTFNAYSTLYLRFKIAHVLATDLGVDCRYFTKYYAPEYSPQMQSYVIQENEAIRTEVGNYPFCNVYANFMLKSCRFYVMMSHVNCSGKGNYFLTPHYPENGRILRVGLNWNFLN